MVGSGYCGGDNGYFGGSRGDSRGGDSEEGDSEGGASQKMEDLIWVDIEDDVALVTVICLKLGDRLTEGLFGGA